MPGLRIFIRSPNSPIMPILTLKLVVTMATSREPSEIGGQIGNLWSSTYQWNGENLVKIGPVDAEFSLLKRLF